MRLDHCVIAVSDWDAANAFYTTVVGAELIEAAIDHLTRHGVAIEAGPVTRHGAQGAGTSVYFRDPDGSLLEFISYG
jgi:catechol 2,3-dioxygenase-like lactoylglutathione lyase family enzyme